MKNMIFGIAVLACTIIAGCVNPYSQYYQDQTKGEDILQSGKVVIPPDIPNHIRGTNPATDAESMAENGYSMIGQSLFNCKEIDERQAIKHGKKVHADTVITYSQYTHTLSGMAPMTVPNTQYSTTNISGNVYGRGYSSFSGTANTTTYGTQTTYVPYHVRRYDYLATYWIKLKPESFGLGIYFDDLPDEIKQKIESNRGVIILAVVKNTNAYRADIIKGDVILRANNKIINDKNAFQDLIKDMQGQTVNFEIFRNNNIIYKEIKIGK
jgi:hypothetical protein